MDNMFKTIDMQKIGLDGSWLRNEAISNNMANANTPNYKRQDVAFEDILKDFLDQNKTSLTLTNSRHMSINGNMPGDTQPKMALQTDTSFRMDKNNVDMDTEVAEMTKNSMYYNAMVTEVNSQFRRIKMAVKEGR